jgi:hypothetical protein
MLRRVALVRTDVSSQRASVPSSPTPVTLMMESLSSSEMSVLPRVTLRNIPEDGILDNHRREILKSYIVLNCLSTGRASPFVVPLCLCEYVF